MARRVFICAGLLILGFMHLVAAWRDNTATDGAFAAFFLFGGSLQLADILRDWRRCGKN